MLCLGLFQIYRKHRKEEEMKQVDRIEVQSLALTAESMAEKLLKQHDGNISAIEKALGPKIHKGGRRCFEKEVLWAAKWLISINQY